MNRIVIWIVSILSFCLFIGFLWLFFETKDLVYGLTIFSFVPFVVAILMGALKTELCLKREKPLHFWEIWLRCFGWFWVVILLLIGLVREGAVCMAMALPILIPFHFLGVYIGYRLARKRSKNRFPIVLALVFLTPPSFYLESEYFNEPTILQVETSVEIAANPESIWQVLSEPIEFGDSPFFFFKAGVTYPKSMRMAEKGGQSVLLCEYNNGEGVNPILKKIPNRELQFTLMEDPVPMKELNPFGEVHAPHLEGYLKIYSGQILIEKISEKKSRVIAKTIYHYNLHPISYWKLWTQTLFDQMHQHVLQKIKEKSERYDRSL